ncbi:hypothetical protein [Lysobacter sp. FW306-1B-D06B]|uniref:hypothetical protein n=1 Tax=Lysobacter sp. FW306-1B-D06B TaxID=3140250 RepID=UPI00313FFEE8
MKRIAIMFFLLLATFGANAQQMCGLTRWNDAINASGVTTTFATREAAQAACNSVASKTAYPDVSGWFYEITKESCTLNVAAKNFTIKGNRTGTNYHPTCNQGHQSWSPGTATATGWYFNGPICATGQTWNAASQSCTEDCSVKQPITGTFTPPNGSLRCHAGCRVFYSSNGDGTSTASATGQTCTTENEPNVCSEMNGYYWHPTLNVCAPTEPDDCKPGQDGQEGVCNKPEECPAGMKTDENGLCKRADPECPAGATKGPDGSCVDDKTTCKAGEAKKNDGTCGKDENNDGKPDDEDDDPDNDSEKNEFSGGDDCKSPPRCAGDPIMCGQARIQWRIECNTRQNVNLTGGGCNNPPQCQGEKCTGFEMAQLVQQWRTACAVEGLKTVGGGGDGQQPEWTKPSGMTQDAGQGSSDGDTDVHSVETIDGADLDQSGFVGGGGSCPGFGIASGGSTLAGSFLGELATPPPFFCNFISWIYAITVLLFGVLPSLYILAGYKGS